MRRKRKRNQQQRLAKKAVGQGLGPNVFKAQILTWENETNERNCYCTVYPNTGVTSKRLRDVNKPMSAVRRRIKAENYKKKEKMEDYKKGEG